MFVYGSKKPLKLQERFLLFYDADLIDHPLTQHIARSRS